MSERSLLRQRIWRYRLGFSLVGLALAVASLMEIGRLILIFRRNPQNLGALLGISQWEMLISSVVVFGSLIGVALLWGSWPDVNWQRRSGLLLLMSLVDAVLFLMESAPKLGLVEGEFGHEWFRESLGMAMAWSEFALTATLAADMAAHLGEPQSIDMAKAVRSLATTGAMVWFMYFYSQTNWQPPLWPLRANQPNPGTVMLALGFLVLRAINFVQVTGLSLLASRCCSRALREMNAADRAVDQLPSRSEQGWDEMNKKSIQKDGR